MEITSFMQMGNMQALNSYNRLKIGKLEDALFDFLAQYMPLSEEEKKAIIDMDIFRTFKKGTILLREGELSFKSYFVIKGCIRCYYVIDGEEKTTAFYTESESITPLCIVTRKPSEYYISCVEDCILTAGNQEEGNDIFERFPRFETLCRKVSEVLIAKNQATFDNFKTSSPEQRYLNLVKTRPDLLQRVPQYQMASFLGITPQSLSRMRGRLVKNHK